MKKTSGIFAAIVLVVFPAMALAKPATHNTGTRQNASQYHDRTPKVRDRSALLAR